MNQTIKILACKNRFIRRLEKALTGLSPLASLYSRLYFGVVKQEIRLAAIGHRDIIINIGCGAIPFTAIHLARLTGARVIALDRDREAAECARRHIKASGLTEIIRVVWDDGAKALEGKRATVWIAALQAAPKEAILTHFQKSAPPGARIMFREPRPAFISRYDHLPYSTQPQSMAKHNMVTFNRSVLFTQEA